MNAAIKSAAKALAAKSPHLAVGAGPLLEAWVALELGAQLKAKGLKVHIATKLESGKIEYNKKYLVRTSQKTPTKAPGTSWLEITARRRRYEIHNSLQLRGLSWATHEADVCMLNTHGTYPVGLPYVVIECKNYKSGAMPCNAVRSVPTVRADVPNALRSLWCVLSTSKRTANSKLIGDRFGIPTYGSVVPSPGHADIADIIIRMPHL